MQCIFTCTSATLWSLELLFPCAQKGRVTCSMGGLGVVHNIVLSSVGVWSRHLSKFPSPLQTQSYCSVQHSPSPAPATAWWSCYYCLLDNEQSHSNQGQGSHHFSDIDVNPAWVYEPHTSVISQMYQIFMSPLMLAYQFTQLHWQHAFTQVIANH